MTETTKYTITTILIETSAGNLPVNVSAGIDAVVKEFAKEPADGYHHFAEPLSGHRILIPSKPAVIAISEQEIQVVTDPRVLGQTRTRSGIELPS